MARPVLPTVALTRSRVPTSADGKQGAFFEFNGYEAAGDQDTMVDIMRRAEADGLASLTIHELRIEIFRTIRAMRQAFEYDTGNRHIEASLGMIHEILDARGPHVGVWRGDLTTLDVDAVVNAANERMLGGGGVDGAIHRAAGPGLLAACRAVPEVRPGVRCPTGEARVTPGFDLPASHVIHAVGPVWRGGGAGEDDLLASAYRNSLRLAAEHGAASVAFPAISTGVFGFPADRAARVAVDTVRTWQAEHGGPLAVVLVAFDAAAEAVLRDALA